MFLFLNIFVIYKFAIVTHSKTCLRHKYASYLVIEMIVKFFYPVRKRFRIRCDVSESYCNIK